MSGVAVKILAADVLARLQGMEARGQNLLPVFQDFGGHMKGSIDKNFSAQGRPIPWAPLKPQTLNAFGYRYARGGEYRTKKGYPTKAGRELMANRMILCGRTGHLRTGFFSIATPRSITVTNKWNYLIFHVLGTKFLPIRNPLLFQDQDIDYLERTIVNFVMTGRLA